MKKKLLFRNIFKKFFTLKKKSKKKIKEVEKVEIKKEIKENIFKLKYKKYKNHIILQYGTKITSFKQFLFIVIGYGLIINLPFYFILGFSKFNLGTIFGFGIIYYFIKDEFIEWFRPVISAIKQKEVVR